MSRRLAPLIGMKPPNHADTEGDVRMIDIQVVLDVCIEAQSEHRGARRRVAQKHGVCASTVTECIKRVDRALGAPLFQASAGGYGSVPSPAGIEFVRSGRMFLQSYQAMRKQVQRAADVL